jgi:outer membrane protein assembly factor BamB
VILLGTWGYYSLLRIDGMSGAFDTQLSWRWNPTAEDRFLAARKDRGAGADAGDSPARTEITVSDADWPGFRGAGVDSRYTGAPIATHWTESPPRQLWKRPVGPGWSSFAVVGNRIFTQEQRGEEEIVSCYDADTGRELWSFADRARFEEVVAGAGPRATPTFFQSRIYAAGATGMVHCLDASTGQSIWRASMVGPDVKLPEWGYACSPMIAGNTVVLLPGRPTGAAVVGLDADTGRQLWAVGDGNHSYTSLQPATLAGVRQLLALTSEGLMGIDPAGGEGKILWFHSWPAEQITRCVQPYVEDDTILISTYFGVGSRKVKVSHDEGNWSTTVLWESQDMKPYFNDLVVLDGHAYGFDGSIFCCLNLETGKRTWKGGRYGNGQVLLLERQRLLLVLSEQGDVVLLEANPRERKEIAQFHALDGKTWNHPVVAHGKLFVRNGAEMACYDVAPRDELAARNATP